jgi:hypothetical protein
MSLASLKRAASVVSPAMDGQFTIRTDAAILANNTDEGPATDPPGRTLAADELETDRSPKKMACLPIGMRAISSWLSRNQSNWSERIP